MIYSLIVYYNGLKQLFNTISAFAIYMHAVCYIFTHALFARRGDTKPRNKLERVGNTRRGDRWTFYSVPVLASLIARDQ